MFFILTTGWLPSRMVSHGVSRGWLWSVSFWTVSHQFWPVRHRVLRAGTAACGWDMRIPHSPLCLLRSSPAGTSPSPSLPRSSGGVSHEPFRSSSSTASTMVPSSLSRSRERRAWPRGSTVVRSYARIAGPRGAERKVGYLVDPSSSHMLVSKIKPCMSKYKLSHSETANGSLDQLWFIRSYNPYLDNCGNSRANTCKQAPTSREERFY